MKKIALAAAITAAMGMGSAYAGTLVYTETFGTFGDATDIPTNIDETLTVSGWASDIPAGATNISFTVEVRGSLSTFGSATNNGPTAVDVDATVTLLADWVATTSDLSSADYTFGNLADQPINENIGVVAPGETVNFGTFTSDSNWVGVFSGTVLPTSISYHFTNTVISAISGSGNFSSSFTTGSAGGVRVTVSYDDPQPPVPAPAPLAMMGLGLLGLVARRRAKRA